MRFRGTAILFLLLAVLGGWVYWTEIRGREAREEAEEAAGRVLPIEAEEIEAIRLVYPETTLEAVRAGDGWEYVAPEGLEADVAGWDQVAANVGRIERGESVATEPADLVQYGLDSPAVRVWVRLADGRTQEVVFGAPNPSGGAHYTTIGDDPEVFLTPTTWRGLFLKEADDLRDKTLVKFEQADIDRIELFPAGNVLVLEDGEWFLEGPPRLRADDSEVASFLSTLGTTRATGFGEPGESGLEGSAVPAARVTLHDRAGDQRHVLAFGDPVPDSPGLVYARDMSRDPVFTLAPGLGDRILSPASAWRDKTIAEFDPGPVERIEITREGETVRLEKSGDVWSMPDGEDVTAATLSNMLGVFDFQRASEVIDAPAPLEDYGLDSPRLEVVFAGADGEILRFGFGNETPGGIYWKSASEVAVKVVPLAVMTPFELGAGDVVGTAP